MLDIELEGVADPERAGGVGIAFGGEQVVGEAVVKIECGGTGAGVVEGEADGLAACPVNVIDVDQLACNLGVGAEAPFPIGCTGFAGTDF